MKLDIIYESCTDTLTIGFTRFAMQPFQQADARAPGPGSFEPRDENELIVIHATKRTDGVVVLTPAGSVSPVPRP